MYINVQGLNVDGKVAATISVDRSGQRQIVMDILYGSMKELRQKAADAGWEVTWPFLREN